MICSHLAAPGQKTVNPDPISILLMFDSYCCTAWRELILFHPHSELQQFLEVCLNSHLNPFKSKDYQTAAWDHYGRHFKLMYLAMFLVLSYEQNTKIVLKRS